MGKDHRFDEIRSSFWKFLKFWIAQAIVAWVLLLPIIIVSGKDSANLKTLSVSGVGLFLAGLLMETVADLQKLVHKKNYKNKDKWISWGLWRYSRHPNYFGEILVWLGIFLSCIPYLEYGQMAVAALSPLTIFIVLRFVSGVPPLEKYADNKWGNNKDYVAYKNKTPLLVPRFWL